MDAMHGSADLVDQTLVHSAGVDHLGQSVRSPRPPLPEIDRR
jgi:hypothetical protein